MFFLQLTPVFAMTWKIQFKKKSSRDKKTLVKKKGDLSKVHNKIARKTMKNNTRLSEPL